MLTLALKKISLVNKNKFAIIYGLSHMNYINVQIKFYLLCIYSFNIKGGVFWWCTLLSFIFANKHWFLIGSDSDTSWTWSSVKISSNNLSSINLTTKLVITLSDRLVCKCLASIPLVIAYFHFRINSFLTIRKTENVFLRNNYHTITNMSASLL